MLQENHTFDNYFGMLNPYRKANGWDMGDDGKEYSVDGVDDKLTTISNQDDQGDSYALYKARTTCIDDSLPKPGTTTTRIPAQELPKSALVRNAG
jgi:phospholipase C